MIHEQYQKIHSYLLDNGQQELAGHLDGLWNELLELRSDKDSRVSAQEFQDKASEEKPPINLDDDPLFQKHDVPSESTDEKEAGTEDK